MATVKPTQACGPTHPCDDVTPPGVIQEAFDNLEDQVKRLHVEVDNLRAEFHPVLCPESAKDEPSCEQMCETSNSTVTDRLVFLKHQIRQSISAMEEIRARSEC